MLDRSKLFHFCEGPGWAGWILVFQLSYAMNHVAPTLHAEESRVCLLFSAGWLIDSFLFFSCFSNFLHALVNILVSSTSVDSVCVSVCVCLGMRLYCTSFAWCNIILGECAGCKLLHNILFLQPEDIDSEGKQWHE